MPTRIISSSVHIPFSEATHDSNEIIDWADTIDDGNPSTPICPKCGVDAVIPSASGFPLTEEFLKEMQDYWFSSRKLDVEKT